ncbi:antibiotic biosynthesis monooxygenase family protein [Chloroflexota bacterium]
MITVVMVRHLLQEREKDAARLLGELRRREIQQNGCISSEILWSVDDPSMWIDISTWTYSDQWKKWEVALEHRDIESEMQNLLVAADKASIFKIVK